MMAQYIFNNCWYKSWKYCAILFLFLMLNITCALSVQGKLQNSNYSILSLHIPSFVEVNCNLSINECALTCFEVASNKNLNKKIEKESTNCKGDLKLTLDYTKFKEDTFRKTDLEGNFRLHTLNLDFCDLEVIEDNAFNKPSMHDLQKLQINRSYLKKLNNKTFAGLANLKELIIANYEEINDFSEFKANGMLEPMQKNLTQLLFQHTSQGSLKDYDPGDWLQGVVLSALKKVRFQYSYLNDTLNRNSFLNLEVVEELILLSCHISSITDDAFDPIIDTLQHLVLTNNNLKTLSPIFLSNAAYEGIQLTMPNNKWDCDCANLEFMEAMTNETLQVSFVPKCSSPAKFSDYEIGVVKHCCNEGNEECLLDTNISTTTPSSTEPYPAITLSCKSSQNDNNPLVLKDKSADFVINTFLKENVFVVFKTQPDIAVLIFFEHKHPEEYRALEVHENVVVLSNLTSDGCYIFCLISNNEDNVSPFDCRSHFMAKPVSMKDAWILHSGEPVFIAVATISAISCLLFGVFFVYKLLLWRPRILLPHKRLELISLTLQQVFLKEDSAKMTAVDIYEALRTHTKLEPYTYLNYLKSSQLPTKKIEATNFYTSISPGQRAPILPPMDVWQCTSFQTTASVDKICCLEEITEDFNEHVYQSLEECQEIYKSKKDELNNFAV